MRNQTTLINLTVTLFSHPSYPLPVAYRRNSGAPQQTLLASGGGRENIYAGIDGNGRVHNRNYCKHSNKGILMKKVGFLWPSESLGLYSNQSADSLYKGVGHNTGNLAFIYALQNQIQAKRVYASWGFDPKHLADVDAIIVPCANQLGKHTNLQASADRLLALGKPVIAIGLGAQASDMDTDIELSDGTLAWVKAIDSLRPGAGSNIYTRGPYTAQQLAKFGISDAVIGGCPSHFINQQPKLGQRVHDHWSATALPRAISVAAGHQSWGRLRSIEHQLTALMQDPLFPGQYVVQSMADMIQTSREEVAAMDTAILEKIRHYVMPHYTLEEFKIWCRNYARSFYDVAAWMDSLRRFDLSIGPRYHGVALAIQAERMGVTVTLDSRTEEMCLQTGVPFLRSRELAAEPVTRESLKKLIKFDPKTYDTQRAERARNYIAFLEANQLSPAPYLYKIAESKN